MGADTEVRQIIFFDGVCNLCNSSVNFIIDRDPTGKFKFAPMQSDIAKDLLPKFQIDPSEFESLVFHEGDKVYCRSRAVLEIVKRMRRAWPIFYIFILVPGLIRDPIYDFIARNRYKWFGKRDACRMPTRELASRFMDS